MQWTETKIKGALALTMTGLGFSEDEIDLVIFITLCIRHRYTESTIQSAGLEWETHMHIYPADLPSDLQEPEEVDEDLDTALGIFKCFRQRGRG